MLRQLSRLTLPVPAAGPGALAIAIYSDLDGQPAGAAGEGVACVDDAARAVELLALVWQVTQEDWVREWAIGLLDFVLWMHHGDGLWLNFIYDWSGERNLDGLTSRPGVNFWQARALNACVSGALILGAERALPIARLGFTAAAAGGPPADVRSLHVLALARWLDGGHLDVGTSLLSDWADAIAAQTMGDTLMNSPDERGVPHLWGHLQEAALAAAGSRLGRADLTAAAQAGAAALFSPAIQSGFDYPHIQPYDVQTAICVMDALTAATHRSEYADLAGLARAWFSGRNPAGSHVYDRQAGRVADGIDDGIVSRNSGAESNIVGGLALLDDAVSVTLEWQRKSARRESGR